MKSMYVAMRQCYRKKNFRAEVTARKRAAQIVRDGGPQMYPYGCTQCGNFHLTKNKKAEGLVL
jgi:hypothetical protein